MRTAPSSGGHVTASIALSREDTPWPVMFRRDSTLPIIISGLDARFASSNTVTFSSGRVNSTNSSISAYLLK